MDVFVRKLASNSTEEPLINVILKGVVKSRLVCIFDNALHPCTPLLQYIKKEYTIDSFNGVTAIAEKASSSNGLIHLTHFSLDIIASNDRCQLFASLMKFANEGPFRTVILDIQSDILEDSVVNNLKYMANTCIFAEGNGVYSIRHRISGGSREQSERNHLSNGHLSKCKTSSSPITAITPTSSILPTSTFNLEISREQREAKAQVLLPHIRVQMEDLQVTPRVLAEDYDEEDPDDDLEI